MINGRLLPKLERSLADFPAVALLGPRQAGKTTSWEGWVLEQIAQLIAPKWQLSFYRTASGAEMDVVAERGNRKIGFGIKYSSSLKAALHVPA